MTRTRQSGPSLATGTASNVCNTSTPILTELDAETTALARGLVVIVKTPAGHYRRRVFLSLAAAQRAAEAAANRGQVATVVLAELVPVYRVLEAVQA